MTTTESYAALAKKHGYPESLRYRRVLEFLITPQQADLVALLPAEPADIAAKLGIPVETVKSEIEILFRKGVVFPKNFQTRENPRFAREVYQLHDASQSILDLDKKIYSPEAKMELFRLWEDFCENEWYPDRNKFLEGLPQPPLRVVAAYTAIKGLPDIEPFDDMREILKAQEMRAYAHAPAASAAPISAWPAPIPTMSTASSSTGERSTPSQEEREGSSATGRR